MKKFILSLTMMLVLSFTGLLRAAEVVIGEGTSTSYYAPINTYYNYSYTQQLYLAEEIGVAGTINSISFHYASSNERDFPISVFMVATDLTDLSDSFVPVTESDLVFEGTLSVSEPGWVTIDLDSPFSYDGTSNLLIAIDKEYAYWFSGASWYYTSAANMLRYASSDTSNPDPYDPPAGSVAVNRPNMIIDITPSGNYCSKPTGLSVNYEGGITAEVVWNTEANSSNIIVNGNQYNNVSSPYPLNNLELATTYEIQVQANCGNNGLSDWTNPLSFTTDACMPEDQLVINYQLMDSYGDGWNSNYILVVDETCDIVEALTIPNGNSLSGSLHICGSYVQFLWYLGSYPTETSWVFTDADGNELFSGAGNSSMATGDVLYTLDNNPYLTPSDLVVSEVGPHSVKLSWTQNGTATAWQICLDGDTDHPIDANSNPFVLTGLDSETDYTVRVRAVGPLGSGMWACEEVEFTTTEPCPEPQNLDVTPYPTSAVVSWLGFGESYTLEWAEVVETFTPGWKDGGLWLQYDNNTYITSIGSTTSGERTWGVMYPFYMLQGNTTLSKVALQENANFSGDYTINIYVGGETEPETLLATQTVTPGGAAAMVEIALDEPVTIDPTQNLWITVTATGTYVMTACQVPEPNNQWWFTQKSDGTASWSNMGEDNPNLAGYGWMIRGYVENYDSNLFDWNTASPTSSTYTIEGLSPETRYVFRLKSWCGADGESAWTWGTFTTPSACDAPIDLTVTDITAGSATLNWTGYQNSYNVRYRTAAQYNPVWEDDFENGLSNWTIVHGADATAPSSGYWYTINPISGLEFEAFSGSYCASSWSWNNNAYQADNWLISPQIALQGVLKYYVRTNPGYPDSYEVLLSTTTADTTNFTITLKAFAEAPANSEWNEVIIDLGAYAGRQGYIAIHHVGYDMNYLLIDDFGVYSIVDAGRWVTATTTSPTYDLAGLTSNTTYEAQVQGVCSNELTEWTPAINFTTLVSCFAPTNLEVDSESVTTTTATISWESDGTEWEVSLNGTLIGTVYENRYDFTDLNAATSYEVQVRTVCEGNDFSDWVSVSFITNLCDPENQCEITYELVDSYGDGWNGNAIQVVDVETDILLAQWTISSGYSATGSLVVCDGREIEFRWVKGNYPGETSWTVYDVNDVVICSGTGNTSMATGDVLASNTVNCTINPCKVPTSLQATPDAISVELSWIPGTDDQEYWEVCLNGDETNLYAATEIPFTLEGLDPETTYTAKVRANCGEFQSGWSNEVSFTTLEACLHPGTLLLGSFITDHSVELTWTVRDEEQDTWEICLNDDETLLYTAYEVPFTIEGLDPETSYTAKVRANCGEYLSSWSNTVSFTTLESCPDDKVCIGMVGTATNGYLPTYTYYKYSLTEQIYTVEEIGYERTGIASIDFYSNGERTRNLDIYMAETDLESFENNQAWVAVSPADLVFSGTVTLAQNAWTTITFDTPFEYTAQRNVVLVVDDNTGSYVSSANYRVFNAPSQALYKYNDYTNYDPAVPPVGEGTVLSVKNQVRLSLTTINCFKPFEVTLSDTTATSITVNSYATDNDVFDLRYAIASDELVWTVLPEVSNVAVIGNLLPETNYLVQVRTNCGGGEVSYWTGSYTFTTGQVLPMPIIDGWNWIGSPIEFNEGSLNELRQAILSVANGEDAITIKSQTQYTTFQNGNWFGGLNVLDNAQMYMIEADTVISDWQFTGNPLHPEDHPITINPGWNWIPYLGCYEVSLEDALSNMNIYEFDIIKVKGSHAMWSMFMNGQWEGDPSFKSLKPGLGYMYFSNTDEPFQFTYPSNLPPYVASGSKGVTTYWKPNEKDFPTNLTMAVTVELSDNELTQGNYEVGAFVNGECRGAARLVSFNCIKMAFLTVSGEEDDNVIFKLYDVDADYVFANAALERVSYKADDVYGDPLAPMTLHFAVTSVAEDDNTVAIFPNPTSDKIYVCANDIQSVRVFNAMGQCLSAQEFDHATQVELNLGAYSAGVYTVAIRTHNGQLINKMVVRQ